MATNTTGDAGLSPTMVTLYSKMLLERALAKFVHGRWAQRRNLPQRGGKTVNFRKFGALTANTTPLTEGVTPAGKSLSITEIEATISQYGDFVEGSDLLNFTALDPILEETVNVLGEQAADSMDQIVRDVLAAGTSVQYAAGRAGRSSITSADVLTVDEVRKAVRTLEANNATKIGDSYIGIIDPYTKYDIMDDAKWESVNEYAGGTQIYDGEIGRIYGVRFVSTTNAKTYPGAGSGGIDVHATLILGADAYGVVPLDAPGHDAEWSLAFIFKALGTAGTSDPLNQRWTAAWKVAGFASKILQQLYMVRIESAASA